MSELQSITSEKNTIKINGEEREIKFGFSAWAEIEKKYGSVSNFKKIVKDIQERPFATIPELIYIGLKDKSGVTKENVLDDYGLKDMEEISNILYRLLYGSMPTINDDSENKKK